MVKMATIIPLSEAPNLRLDSGVVVVIVVGWWEIKSHFGAYVMLGLFG